MKGLTTDWVRAIGLFASMFSFAGFFVHRQPWKLPPGWHRVIFIPFVMLYFNLIYEVVSRWSTPTVWWREVQLFLVALVTGWSAFRGGENGR